MKKRFFAILLCFCMALTFLPVSAMAQTTNSEAFSDTSGHWAEEAIDVWSEYGIVQGDDGAFRPNAAITRAELAAIINRVAGYQKLSSTAFSDVSTDAWYAKDISMLHAEGIMMGDGSGIMRPAANITREEAVVMMARAFDIEENAGNEDPFPDAANISGWASFLVDGMKAAGYISGDTSGNFNPKSSITRAEVVTILSNLCEKFYGTAGEYSGDVKGNVFVSATDVTLKDMKITGDLYILEGVGEGEVYLENVEVTGRVFARGGGADSLYFSNCTISELVATKDEIHIVFSNGCKVKVLKSNLKDGSIELIGCTVETMTIFGDGLDIKLDSNSAIGTLNADANGITIDGANGAIIDKINLNGQTEITGKAVINEANIEADGCIIETKPKNLNISEGVTAEIAGKEQTGKANPSTPAMPSGGTGGNTVSFSSHNVPSMSNIPYRTDFLQLGLPDEVTLRASDNTTVIVAAAWNNSTYNATKTDAAQTITAAISARSGETLPSWAPATIGVSITVLPMPTPTTLEICRFGFASAIIEDSIAKGASELYSLQVKDENGTIMSAGQLADAGVTWKLDENTEGIAISRNDLSVTIAVAGNYSSASYVFAPGLEYTANGGGALAGQLSIETPAPPSEKVAAVTGLTLHSEYDSYDGKGLVPYLRFTAPADVSDIYRFRVVFTGDGGTVSWFETFVYPNSPEMTYDFSVVDKINMLPPDTYKIEVTSLAQGDNNSAMNNTVLCDYTIELNRLDDYDNRKIVVEKTTYSFESSHVNLMLEYHYSGMVTPEADTFMVDAYFEGATYYGSRSAVSTPQFGKGRLNSHVIMPPEQVGMENLRVRISRFTLDIDSQNKVMSIGVSGWLPIIEITERSDDFWYPRDSFLYFSGSVIPAKPVGTLFADLGLQTEGINFRSNFGEDAYLAVNWVESDYDPNSTAEQEIRGYVNVAPDYNCPAWIPEVVIARVQLF